MVAGDQTPITLSIHYPLHPDWISVGLITWKALNYNLYKLAQYVAESFSVISETEPETWEWSDESL